MELINIGVIPNDTTGDPIRTAFSKCNTNFNELSSRAYFSGYSSSTQLNTAVGSPVQMTLTATDISNDISLVANRLHFVKAGIYNIQFSAQLDRASSGTDIVSIWIQRDSTPEPWSAGHVTLSGNASQARLVASGNYIVSVLADTEISFWWSSASPDVRLLAEAPSTHPGVPSLIITAQQV